VGARGGSLRTEPGLLLAGSAAASWPSSSVNHVWRATTDPSAGRGLPGDGGPAWRNPDAPPSPSAAVGVCDAAALLRKDVDDEEDEEDVGRGLEAAAAEEEEEEESPAALPRDCDRACCGTATSSPPAAARVPLPVPTSLSPPRTPRARPPQHEHRKKEAERSAPTPRPPTPAAADGVGEPSALKKSGGVVGTSAVVEFEAGAVAAVFDGSSSRRRRGRADASTWTTSAQSRRRIACHPHRWAHGRRRIAIIVSWSARDRKCAMFVFPPPQSS
jgi:hypothetical protein